MGCDVNVTFGNLATSQLRGLASNSNSISQSKGRRRRDEMGGDWRPPAGPRRALPDGVGGRRRARRVNVRRPPGMCETVLKPFKNILNGFFNVLAKVLKSSARCRFACRAARRDSAATPTPARSQQPRPCPETLLRGTCRNHLLSSYRKSVSRYKMVLSILFPENYLGAAAYNRTRVYYRVAN